jgi:hypothetical protein
MPGIEPRAKRGAGAQRGVVLGFGSQTQFIEMQSKEPSMYPSNAALPASAKDDTNVGAEVHPPVPRETVPFLPWPLSAERMSGWLSS